MKINFRLVAVLVIAVIVAYFAFDGVSQKTFEGSQVSFSVNTGRVELMNDTGEPVQVRMSAGRTFTIARSDGEEDIAPTREGSGRNLRYVFEGELPPGDLELRVARGADVDFTITASGSIRTLVTPRNDGDTQSLILMALVVVAVLLTYVGYSTKESWMRLLRRGDAGPGEMTERVIET